MKKQEPKLLNPVDEINSALDECCNTLVFSLGYLKVNRVSGTRMIEYKGKHYEITIDAKIINID